MRCRLLSATGIALALVAACSTPDNGLRIDPLGPPPADFDAVVVPLDYRCGSLDCHGSPRRNLRIYGYGGQRLAPGDTPESPPTPTPAEVAATYDAIVGLEPDVMRAVTLAKGEGAERLTFVRKARGEEAHKGGRRIVPGDDADACVLSWLRGAVDVEACGRVPEGP